ncbi:MAG: phenylacetate--CoA ligase family protein, partial [Pseudoclavibacter sp.]
MTNALWYPDEARAWDETRREQARQLPRLVGRLRRSSAMYEGLPDLADTADCPEAFADLPFTTKNDLRDGQARGASGDVLGRQQAVPIDRIEQVISSSGTTGTPVAFGLTRADRAAWTDAIGAFYRTAGVRPGAITALSTGMPMVAGGVPYADGIREAGGALVWFGGQTTPRMAQTLDRLQVDTLVATASFATFFSARVEEELGKPASELDIRTLICGGEPGMGLPDV